MNTWTRSAALFVYLFLIATARSQAAGVIDYVPSNALGYAVVNDVTTTNEKLMKVMSAFDGFFDVMPPAPLTLIKAATGLGAGLNDGGDALIAMLPGSAGYADARPMLLAPVSDYAAFAASLNADAAGGISRVTIMGEEVLVAKRDDYALVMNVEHRPTMETILEASAALAPEIEALAEWANGNDVAIVLSSTGVDAVAEMGQASLDADTALQQQYIDSDNADILADVRSINDAHKRLLAYLGVELAAGGVGLSIDDATNVRLTNRLVFEGEGRLAKLTPIDRPASSPLAGQLAKPFVWAGGGPLPEGWPQTLARLTREIIQAAPEAYGFEKFDEAQWQKLEESWQAAFTVREISIAWLVGDKDEPLFGNIYFSAQTASSSEYLSSMRRSIESWNELTTDSSSDLKLAYKISEERVANRPALLMSVDVAAATADDDVPMVLPLMKAFFGSDGILRFYAVAVDDDTVVMALAPETLATKAVEAALRDAPGLDESPEVQTTTSLLNADAQWTWFVSPPGYAQWLGRLFADAMAPLGAGSFTLPEYPPGAPIGFSAALTQKHFEVEMVMPAQSLKDLGAYMKKVQVQGL